jgi:hypothetical protein
MTVEFLRDISVPVSITRRCGDGCCSWSEWEEECVFKGEFRDAETSQLSFVPSGTVDVSGLKFNEDYIIVEFP